MTKRKTVGYAKLGRSMPLRLEDCGSLGGDVEMVPTLKLLAERHPDVDFVLVGRNSGEHPHEVGLPKNVINPWPYWAPEVRRRINERGLNYPSLSIADHIKVRNILTDVTGDTIQSLDHLIMWLGQHGTTNTPLPSVKDRSKLTKPYDWATLYCSYLLQGINAWRDVDPHVHEEILLNSDARNYPKYRDTKWPMYHPVLAQYNQFNSLKHERYGDHNARDMGRYLVNGVDTDDVWQCSVASTYCRLEISALVPGTPFADTVEFNDDHKRPHSFGMVVNETRREVNPARARVNVLKKWVLPLRHIGFIHGRWSDSSQGMLGRTIEPIPVLDYIGVLQTTTATFTTPASGSGWATAKPWECFAAGTVCFFHPAYDDQDNILGDAPKELRDFLRVDTPAELQRRVDMVSRDEETWLWAISLQKAHFDQAVADLNYLKEIEERLGL